MKSRIFVLMGAITVFAVLGVRIRVAAQVEQEQPNNQTNYFVKNLDTLEDTWTVARCMSNASPVFADTRPGARAIGFNPQCYTGFCAVNPNTYKLTGECVCKSWLQGICSLRSEPNLCPAGLFVSTQDRSYESCNRHPAYLVDRGRPCN